MTSLRTPDERFEDLPGFGRSDKQAKKEDYSFALHRDTLTEFIKALDLRDLSMLVQDWGGRIGLTVASEMPERMARLVIMNTGLPDGTDRMPDAFHRWLEFSQGLSDMPIKRIVKGGLGKADQISPEELAAYDAPFPDVTYKAGAMVWPSLVPLKPEEPGAAEIHAAREVLSSWKKPVLVMSSDLTRGPSLPQIPRSRRFPLIFARVSCCRLREI